MAVGAGLVAVGLFLTFPPAAMASFYELSPILAFPGVFMAGVGDPLITIAALRAMYDLQVRDNASPISKPVELIANHITHCPSANF